MHHPHASVALLLAVLTIAAGACSAAEEPAASNEPTQDDVPEPGEAPGSAGPTDVELLDFEIRAPDTAPTGEVFVSNVGEVAHTFTADDGSWDTGTIDPGADATITITEPGTYDYVCTLHPARMTGTIEITAG